jgi:phosphotransferase system enzyme I (PtsI)
MARHVDFMSIGTNDLIQYTLAIDRENDDVNYLYEPLHPAILRLIKLTCDAGRKAGIPVSLCGEMAGDPRYTWVLVGLGLRELSMQASAIPVIKNVIRSSSLDEMEALAAAVLAAETGEEARRLVMQEIGARFDEHLQHTAGIHEEHET